MTDGRATSNRARRYVYGFARRGPGRRWHALVGWNAVPCGATGLNQVTNNPPAKDDRCRRCFP